MPTGKIDSNLNAANIKYNTIGFGYIYYITENAKEVLWYDRITNEKHNWRVIPVM